MLNSDVEFEARFGDSADSLSMTGSAKPEIGSRVLKVGQETGATSGRIVMTSTITLVRYEYGDCWFKRLFVIEGMERTALFSDYGDSGVLVIQPDGKGVGMVIAGDGVRSYAFPLKPALKHLGCTLISKGLGS